MSKPTTFKNILIKPENRAEQFNKGIKSKERVKRYGEVFTPDSIVIDMLDMLNQEIDDKNFIDVTFLEPSCGNGQFLVRILYRKLLQVQKLQVEQRKNAIIKALNNIYGIDILEDNVKEAKDRMLNLIVGNTVKSFDLNNTVKNISINMGIDFKEDFIAELNFILDNNIIVGDALKDDIEFKIDVVVGNPPYNNDLYLDFVTKAHNWADKVTCMITPAKWQAKGGEKNEAFRQNIVPHMSKIVYYRDSKDIFNIDAFEGISYYIIDKNNIYSEKYIKNICSRIKNLNSDFEKQDFNPLVLCNKKIRLIINKCNSNDMTSLATRLVFKQGEFVKNTDSGDASGDIEVMQGNKVCGYKTRDELFTLRDVDKYKVISSIMPGAGVSNIDSNGKVYGSIHMDIIEPNQVPKGSFPCLITFDDENSCRSFVSYCASKLMSFLFYIGVVGSTMTQEFWRFIPDPGKFDHIFTDEELYKKYNLTNEEINIVESVIKERK